MSFTLQAGSALGSTVELGEMESHGVVSTGISSATAAFSTTSTTFVDVTNPATLTLSGLTSGHTYTIIAWATGTNMRNTNADARYNLRLDINGTAQNPSALQVASATDQDVLACYGHLASFTGATTVDIKLQLKGEAGTKYIDYGAADRIATIIGIAIRTA